MEHKVGLHPDDTPAYINVKTARCMAGGYPLLFSSDCPVCNKEDTEDVDDEEEDDDYPRDWVDDWVDQRAAEMTDEEVDAWIDGIKTVSAQELSEKGFDLEAIFEDIDKALEEEEELQPGEYLVRY